MTTGKTIALTTWTFVGKVLFLLYNTLSRFVIAFLSSNFMLAFTIHSDFRGQEGEICHCFYFSFYLHEVIGPDSMILVYFFDIEF